MKTIKTLKLSSLFLFILIATQSCMVSSLHPLYTDNDRVHKEELNGKWITDDGTKIEITTRIDSIKLETLNKEESFMLGLNHNKREIQSDIKTKMKQEKYFFYPNSMKFYLIKITTKKNTSYLEGRLAKLDEYYFLDVIPNGDYLEQKLDDDNMISLVVPMHGFFKLKFIDEKLKFNWINYQDFIELRENKKIRLEHLSKYDREIITAKTLDIQKFLIKFADSKLFNNKVAELILTPLK